jgi:NADH-quinone oxidoreductase subunit C
VKASHAPRYADEPASLAGLARARKREGIETAFDVYRDDLVDVLRTLRDEHEYQQLMEIAGSTTLSGPSGSKSFTASSR